MNVPVWVWIITGIFLLVLLIVDLMIVDRKPHQMKQAECVRWLGFYLMCAAGFACAIWWFEGSNYAEQFVAGYVTEYSLSVDNLFVFVLIITRFAVPTIHEHRVLLFGLFLALLVRGTTITIGAVAITAFTPVFYIFGAFLIYTAVDTARSGSDAEDTGPCNDPLPVRLLRNRLPVVDRYHAARMTVKIEGKRYITRMLIVVVVIGFTDLLFALDSIPAVFGITKEPYLVFTANAFALMGLRQLYFLLSTLLRKLVYLPYGLAVILGFIGIKLVLEAMRANSLPFINHGADIHVPVPDTGTSLAFIVGVLFVTTILSLVKARLTRRRGQQGTDTPHDLSTRG